MISVDQLQAGITLPLQKPHKDGHVRFLEGWAGYPVWPDIRPDNVNFYIKD